MGLADDLPGLGAGDRADLLGALVRLGMASGQLLGRGCAQLRGLRACLLEDRSLSVREPSRMRSASVRASSRMPRASPCSSESARSDSVWASASSRAACSWAAPIVWVASSRAWAKTSRGLCTAVGQGLLGLPMDRPDRGERLVASGLRLSPGGLQDLLGLVLGREHAVLSRAVGFGDALTDACLRLLAQLDCGAFGRLDDAGDVS